MGRSSILFYFYFFLNPEPASKPKIKGKKKGLAELASRVFCLFCKGIFCLFFKYLNTGVLLLKAFEPLALIAMGFLMPLVNVLCL